MTPQDTEAEHLQNLRANIARALGISKHTAAMKSVMQLIAEHEQEVADAARIDELEILDKTDKKDPAHELDIPSYVEWRQTELQAKKGKANS